MKWGEKFVFGNEIIIVPDNFRTWLPSIDVHVEIKTYPPSMPFITVQIYVHASKVQVYLF